MAHAASMGARAQKAGSIAELESMAAEAIGRTVSTSSSSIPTRAIDRGGRHLVEVGVPEVSERAEVANAYKGWLDGKKRQLMRGE